MEYLEYAITMWHYLPYVFYTFVFLTFIPKSLKKINEFAKADYEANRNKYHRCYAPDICCHSLNAAEHLPKQKPRKAVTRVYPKKQSAKKEQPAAHATAISVEEPSNIYKRQVHTHTNVNKIAKMFESGGVQKKINRVTPTILPDFRRSSMDLDDDIFERKDICSLSINESLAKKDHVVLRRLSKLSQELEENNENSLNAINQMPAGNSLEDFNSGWRSESITTDRRKRHIPTPLICPADNSATPSTMSPSHSSPLSSPEQPSSPVQQFAPLLNMKSSLEDIFAAIAKSAESSESLLYRGCNSLSPVTSIDDILSQRRLSRPLSAYSISDLLNEENNTKGSVDEAYMENFFKVLNKT